MDLTGQQTRSDVSTRPETAAWWTRPFEMLQTNLREIDAGLDVEATLDYIQQHGANTWLVNAGGILAFHPSDLEVQTRNPYLSERPSADLLGDAVSAAHARGMRVMARMDFSKVARPIAEAHPDWCFRSPSGELQVYEGLVSVCPSGGYYQRSTFDIIDEVLDRYPVDGFFFNWFGYNETDYSGVYHGVCHCSSCVDAFAAQTHERLPHGPDSPGYRAWQAFCLETLDDLTTRIRAHIAARRPDAALILGKKSDVIFHEANNKVGRELWHHATAEAVSASKTVRPHVPVLVNAVAFVDMPYRMASEEAHHFAHYFVQAIARGANPSTYIMGPPGAIAYDNLSAAAEVTRFHRRWRPVYDAMVPAAEVALVRPDRLAQSAERQNEAVAEFRGWYCGMQQEHVPFDVLPLEGLAEAHRNGLLGRYRAVVLPDVGQLSDAVVSDLDAYAASGGSVVASGSSTVTSDGMVQLPCLPAIRSTSQLDGFRANRSSYFVTDGEVLPVYGTRRTFEWRDGNDPTMVLMPQAPFGPPEKAYGHLPTTDPGLVVQTSCGAARSLQFSWTIGRSYHELGTTNLRRAMLASVHQAAGRQVSSSSDLPEQVEVIMAHTSGAVVVHLVNFSGARRRSFGPPVTVIGATLRLPKAVGRHALSLTTQTACVTHIDTDDLVIELPPLGQFDAIVITQEPTRPEELQSNDV